MATEFRDRFTGTGTGKNTYVCAACGHTKREHIEGFVGGRLDGQAYCHGVHTPAELGGRGHTCVPEPV